MGDINNLLNKERSKLSVNKDTYLNINFSQNHNVLPSGDMNRILNVGEQFEKERGNSSTYRFIFTLNSLLTNVLTDITFNSNDTLRMFREDLFIKDGDGDTLFDNLDESINNYLTNINGWYGYYVPKWYSSINYLDFSYIGDENINNFRELEPKKYKLDFTPITGVKNWGVFITYPKYEDRDHYLVNGGLIIINTDTATLGSKKLKMITVPVKHNLIPGNTVKINDMIYSVSRIGDDGGDNQEYIFVINLPFDSTDVVSEDRMVKMYNGNESEYYFRKFEKLTIENDAEIYPLMFGTSVYNDKTNQIVINKDIKLSGYTDNLGRPISEVYLTIVKKENYGFSSIKSGVDIPFLDTTDGYLSVSDIRRIHNCDTNTFLDIPISHNFIESDLTGDYIYGDIVEYNKYSVDEVILGEVSHRFNLTNRDDVARPEGYLYKPHYRIPVRYWSTFIEQGDITTDNLPEYAQDLGDGRYLWRDLLDVGGNDGQAEIIDYPFLNGCHYPYRNISFMLRRQDPYNNYNLYYPYSPRDIYGGVSYLDNLNIKKENTDDGCC